MNIRRGWFFFRVPSPSFWGPESLQLGPWKLGAPKNHQNFGAEMTFDTSQEGLGYHKFTTFRNTCLMFVYIFIWADDYITKGKRCHRWSASKTSTCLFMMIDRSEFFGNTTLQRIEWGQVHSWILSSFHFLDLISGSLQLIRTVKVVSLSV